jgi:hypothetical protein
LWLRHIVLCHASKFICLEYRVLCDPPLRVLAGSRIEIYATASGNGKVAADIKVGSKSNRLAETITLLASKLKKVFIQTYAKGDEAVWSMRL